MHISVHIMVMFPSDITFCIITATVFGCMIPALLIMPDSAFFLWETTTKATTLMFHVRTFHNTVIVFM